MPTGYTADVQSGKVATLREYAMQCARAFGALVHMRDDPFDAPIPTKIEPDDYHVKKIAENENELARLRNMSREQCAVEAAKKHSEELEYRANRRAENKVEIDRYKAMLKKAQAWNCPTPDHENFKAFLVSQLAESIKFDDLGDYYKGDPVPMSGDEWRENAIETTKQNLKYHQESNAKEIEHAASKTKWLQDLVASLG